MYFANTILYYKSIVGLSLNFLADLSAVLYLMLSPYNMNWCPTALNWNTQPALGMAEGGREGEREIFNSSFLLRLRIFTFQFVLFVD